MTTEQQAVTPIEQIQTERRPTDRRPTERRPVAFITGSSRGIGLGIARQLAWAGFDLALNGVRDEAAVTDVVTELRETGAGVIYCQGSIADAATRTAMLAKIEAHFGRLNVLVNNAGMAPRVRADLLDATEESFDEVLNVNLKGTYFLMQAAANWFIRQQETDAGFRGSLINISSMSATVASVNRGEYCISKAGLSMATQLFAVRLGALGIPVYEVRPGVIKTDMTAGVAAKYDALIANGLTVQPRWGLPDDVGRAVAAIASGAFPYSTGQVFMIDGGLTLARL